ncbi:Ectonucleoside triphosphate diphosphohydrolase 1, partial [Clonorchis sinensis]
NKFVNIKMHHCFKAIYVVTLLHDGLHFPENYEKLHRVDEINGTDVQWSLGAIFFILNAIPNRQGSSTCQAFLIGICVFIIVLMVLCFTIICACRRCFRRAQNTVQFRNVTVSQTSPCTQTNTHHNLRPSTYRIGSVENRTAESIVQVVPV